jgi:hypothetical protein
VTLRPVRNFGLAGAVQWCFVWAACGGSPPSDRVPSATERLERDDGIWCLTEDAAEELLPDHGCFMRNGGRVVTTVPVEERWTVDGVEARGGLYECSRQITSYPDGSWTTDYAQAFGVRWRRSGGGLTASNTVGQRSEYERCSGRIACRVFASLVVEDLPDCDAVESGQIQPVLRHPY